MPPPLADTLARLGEYIDELRHLLVLSTEPALRVVVERAIERMVQVIVACATDAGRLWLTDHGSLASDAPATVFAELLAVGAIPENLARRAQRDVAVRERIDRNSEGLTPAGTRRDAEQLAEDAEELLRCLLAA